MTTKKKSLEGYAEERAAAKFSENATLRRELNAVRSEYGTARAELARVTDDLEALNRIYDEALVLQPQPKWLDTPDAGKKANSATLVAFLSDLHAGEVVRSEEMNGYNAYNLAIADHRLRRFFDKTIMLAQNYMTGVQYEGIILALGGDLVSGDIHDELEQTNELSVLETTLWVAPRILAGIEKWAEVFGKVHVVSAPGNHGRDSKLPRHKGRSAHNADTHIAKMIAMFFGAANSTADVTFDIPDSFDVGFSIGVHQFSMEHGDNLKFSGTSEVGALGPVKRGTMRKSNQHSQEGHPFDYNLVGHFHQYVPAASQGFVMNGSMKGFDEYARSWHLKPEPAQQALMVCTPEYGLTLQSPIIVGDRAAEGW